MIENKFGSTLNYRLPPYNTVLFIFTSFLNFDKHFIVCIVYTDWQCNVSQYCCCHIHTIFPPFSWLLCIHKNYLVAARWFPGRKWGRISADVHKFLASLPPFNRIIYACDRWKANFKKRHNRPNRLYVFLFISLPFFCLHTRFLLICTHLNHIFNVLPNRLRFPSKYLRNLNIHTYYDRVYY